MTNIPHGLIENALNAKAEHVQEADLQRITQNGSAVNQMISEFPQKWAKSRLQAALLFQLVSERGAPLDALKQAAGALIYLGAPIDLIPDDESDGFADDAAVVALAVKRLEAHVRSHCESQGLDPNDYL